MSIASTYPDFTCTPNSTFSKLGVGEPPDGVFCSGVRHHSGLSGFGYEDIRTKAVAARWDRYGQLQSTPYDLLLDTAWMEADPSFSVRLNVGTCYPEVQSKNFTRKLNSLDLITTWSYHMQYIWLHLAPQHIVIMSLQLLLGSTQTCSMVLCLSEQLQSD
jgi:hypothetical protein